MKDKKPIQVHRNHCEFLRGIKKRGATPGKLWAKIAYELYEMGLVNMQCRRVGPRYTINNAGRDLLKKGYFGIK